jgi:tetratricopeptide (TPR) repeat protein
MHLILEDDIEPDPVKKEKLKAFTERAKQISSDSKVHRIYAVFDNLNDFKEKVAAPVSDIRRHLEQQASPKPVSEIDTAKSKEALVDPIPSPPTLYAEPPYIGSHKFVGRQSQLDDLNDWAQPANPHVILLFDAIGGSGKSMLTWQWTNKYAGNVRKDWAGIFWYSFYERGAVMVDFCRHALAYMTGHPLETFKKQKTTELKALIIHYLKSKPWLFILDGLERVLVAYNRIDAAEIPDEDLNTPTDKIVNRDPCSCIRYEDDDLLRLFASASPSKMLISSRLVPHVLFNDANQPIPNVQRIVLPGLRPADAEALFLGCEVFGDSGSIQNYLATNCDCHPLTVGVLAGLINNYLPDKGNFDKWLLDPTEGASLNLADLDLVQKRNHILKAGLKALDDKSRQLLSTLALLSEAVDYKTLAAFNPHLPPEPDAVSKPDIEDFKPRPNSSDSMKTRLQAEYDLQLKNWRQYTEDFDKWQKSSAYITAPKELAKTIKNLEIRGLLQYDHNTKRYDLHPVVRGVALGSLESSEKQKYGRQVVDYFSSQSHHPYEQAETMEDVSIGLNLIKTLLKLGEYQQAYDAYAGGLHIALAFNLEANSEALSVLKPFLPNGWDNFPIGLTGMDAIQLMNLAGILLINVNQYEEATMLYSMSIKAGIEFSDLDLIFSLLNNIEVALSRLEMLSAENKVLNLMESFAVISGEDIFLFIVRLRRFFFLGELGKCAEAMKIWELLDPMGRDWKRNDYRPGHVEFLYARQAFHQGKMTETDLSNAEKLANQGKNRLAIRGLHSLRGMWLFEQESYSAAMESFNNSVQMDRAIGNPDLTSEVWLTLTKLHLNELSDPIAEAERLSAARHPANKLLAELWFAIGDTDKAKKYAIAAFNKAVGSGEPYVFRCELNKSIDLLNRLGVTIPEIPQHDPAKDKKFDWEDDVLAFIEKMRKEKEGEDDV